MRDVNGKRVAVLVDNYFEQAEFEEPIRALKDAGAEVTVIAAEDKGLQALNHVFKGAKFKADLLLAQADSADYDALILPGGVINADSLRVNEDAIRWVTDFLSSDRPVAVICHAPWLLVSADLVDGRRLTSYHTLRDDIINAGGEWVDMPVVIDGNLITSRQPEDIPLFNQALLTILEDQRSMASRQRPDEIIAPTEMAHETDSRLRFMGYHEERDEMPEEEILDQQFEDPDVLQPSSLGPNEESTDTY